MDAEVEVALGDERRDFQCHCAQDLVEPGSGRRALLAQLLHLGQGQHLVGQQRGAVHGVADFVQGLLWLHIAVQGGLHLGLEHGQRRAQLVRCVAHKALLVPQQVAQALHDLVGGVHQRLQLARGQRGGDGAQVAFTPGLQLLAELANGLGGALHHQHHGEGDHRDQQCLAQQGVAQDLKGQGFAHFQRLGHLDHRHGPPLGAGHRLQQHGDAHIAVAKAVVVKVHQGRVGRAGMLPCHIGRSSKPDTISPFRVETR